MEQSTKRVTVYEPTARLADRGKTASEPNRKPKVAAYCRVSTETEEQQGSFKTQVDYYTSLIEGNPDWEPAGIYADEGISGAQADNRPEFLRMINDALNGKIDIIYMKSVSRMGRNTLDNVYYIRMLRDKGIFIRFEEERMDTASEQCEFMLTLMSSLGQQEILNTSAHVKKTFKMRMERGELVGGTAPLGYGYDANTRNLYIIEEEAKIVRFIFDKYCSGVGCLVIARECEARGYLTKRGSKVWHDTTVLGIITNERYKGDLLQGKTFTVDPISKRRLVNMGESASAYVENHHPPIVSREIWEKANEIRSKRAFSRKRASDGKFTKYSREHTMSSMLQCGFCGKALSRKAWNSGTDYKKVVWQCCGAIRVGKRACPHSKGIPEEIVQKAFVLAYNLVFKDKASMISGVMSKIETVLTGGNVKAEATKLRKERDRLKAQIKKLTDLFIDEEIDEEAYKQKNAELKRSLEIIEGRLKAYNDQAYEEGSLLSRLKKAKSFMDSQSSAGIKTFSSELFSLVVEQVVVGSKNGEIVDPYTLTFIFKGSDAKKIGLRDGLVSTQLKEDVPPALHLLLQEAGDALLPQSKSKKALLKRFEKIACTSLHYPHTVFKGSTDAERRKVIESEIPVICVIDMGEEERAD